MRGTDAGPVLDSTGVARPVALATVFSPSDDAQWVAAPQRRRRGPGRRRRAHELPSLECANVQTMLSLLEEFNVVAYAAPRQTDRALATVLFTDIVASTAHAAALGDGAWKQVLDHHDDIARSAVAACGGQLVKGTGDGILATFDVPARALDCAKALRAALAHGGIAIRAGIHSGEVELRDGDVSGIGVNIAARVAALAGAGELLVSRTVTDLVAGAGYVFASRGRHSLKGVPGHWELLTLR